MKYIRPILNLCLIFCLAISCSQEYKRRETKQDRQEKKLVLEKVNRFLVRKDEQTIRDYCKRRGWQMQMTQSGLWFKALKITNLDLVKTGNWVDLKYQISLLDGTVVYDSDSLGIKQFEVGHGGVESGLEEGILMMRKGEKYRFIMPPHKAHGLMGDMKGIPPRSIIVYQVEVLEIR